MEIFWSDIRGADPARSAHPGRSLSPGSGYAWSLLAYAVRQVWNCVLPEVDVTSAGKPFFPGRRDICFSLSHTKGFVLAAVSSEPVGADVEYRRKLRPAAEQRLLRTPHGDLDAFELWTLRESFYKLVGEGSLRDLPFSRENGVILGPREDLKCALYDVIPDCSAAVCSLTETPSKKLHRIPAESLISQGTEASIP